MKVKELIERLSKLDPEASIMLLDSNNGNGTPRDLNYGPRQYTIQDGDADSTADCEQRVGETVYVLGYGCY